MNWIVPEYMVSVRCLVRLSLQRKGLRSGTVVYPILHRMGEDECQVEGFGCFLGRLSFEDAESAALEASLAYRRPIIIEVEREMSGMRRRCAFYPFTGTAHEVMAHMAKKMDQQ